MICWCRFVSEALGELAAAVLPEACDVIDSLPDFTDLSPPSAPELPFLFASPARLSGVVLGEAPEAEELDEGELLAVSFFLEEDLESLVRESYRGEASR